MGLFTELVLSGIMWFFFFFKKKKKKNGNICLHMFTGKTSTSICYDHLNPHIDDLHSGPPCEAMTKYF
ncbi:hypothetical protein ACN38_g3726 [Penicillium nordicum]|uniref:Uncharacterized protein n=1 Tax=Penicillium nordicum TaxID=229535 RepID=A0A0M9WHR0_9EURO|nr:hypothetical protein ACN38_g3726 [Penicillium nordicum]